MRHNYRSHGKHCYLRSFKTNCKKCGEDVLYWECTHGSKLFFNYPPYGKLIRHYCRKMSNLDRRKTFPVIVKIPDKNLIKSSPSCPACGKLFKNEEDVLEHLKHSNKSDDAHKLFFESANEGEQKNNVKPPDNWRVEFGKINIKHRKKF